LKKLINSGRWVDKLYNYANLKQKGGIILLEIRCTHCNEVARFEKVFQGNIKKIEEQSGFKLIPISPERSTGGKPYCTKCIALISGYNN